MKEKHLDTLLIIIPLVCIIIVIALFIIVTGSIYNSIDTEYIYEDGIIDKLVPIDCNEYILEMNNNSYTVHIKVDSLIINNIRNDTRHHVIMREPIPFLGQETDITQYVLIKITKIIDEE